MKNTKVSTLLSLWIILLVIELLWFSNLTNEVHDQDDVLFIITIIFVTLIVGAVWLVITALETRGHKD